jgi:hypothetical protein
MTMRVKSISYLFYCLLTVGQLKAQFPVQVIPQLTPPYSLTLSDYYSSAIPKLTVLLTDRDLTRPSLTVRLKMTISGQSATVSTLDNVYYPPITLDAGIPVRFTGSELAPYFNSDNLSFQGITKAQYVQQGQLPEGYYQFCFEAIETTTGRVISSSSCAMAWLDLSEPPLLNLPSTASAVAYQDPSNIVFSWTPRNMGNPNSAFSTTYNFQLVEITDTTVDPTGAFLMLPPLYITSVATTTFLYGPGLPTLLTGKRYAWRIQAQAISGGQELNLFSNNGYSAVNWFTLQDNCQPPLSSTALIQNGGVHISWVPQSPMLGYEVDYRLQGADTAAWFTEMSTADSIVLYDVSPGQSYEYRIGGACSVTGGTTYGNVQAFTVPAQDTIVNKNCGILPNIDVSNKTPLPALNVGDVFTAGDFPVKVLQTNGSGGVFTGNGYVTVPFLGQAMVKVGWTRAGINTDHKLISGVVVTAFDSTAKQVASADSVAQLITGFAGLINSLVTTPIDGSYQQIQALEAQIMQLVAQQLPQALVNKMDSAISSLNTAKLSYDSAKAVYDSLPPGPAQDSAQQAMSQFSQQYGAAQQTVNQVMAEKDQLIQGVTSVILQAVANIRKEKDSLINTLATFPQDVQTLIQSVNSAQGVDSTAAAANSMGLGDYADDGTYQDDSRSDFLQKAGVLIQRKRAYKGILVYKLFTDFFSQTANISNKLNVDATVNGKDLIDQLITQQQSNATTDSMVQFAHDYLVKALDSYILTLNQ